MRSVVRLRPHHLMCVHGFKGKGYSPEFVTNFWKVIERLNEEDASVEVVSGTRDHICEPCPNNRGEVCAEELKIKKLDDAYAATLEIAPGDTLSWREAKKIIVKKVRDSDFERNCEPCGWKKLGYCKAALEALRKTALLLVALVVLVAAVPRARADDEKSKVVTIDQLEQRLLNDKSRRVPALYKMMSSLAAHDYKKTIDASKAIEGKPELADYYHYILGQAELGRMKKFLLSGSNATALVAAEQAKFHLSQVASASPYSTLFKRANALLGEVEISVGEANIKGRKRQKAMEMFENGFQRLSQVNLLAMVPKSTIVSYAILCERKTTDLCSSWVAKLAPFVVKSEAARVVERVAAFKRPYIERTTQVPYKVDLDLQAFQKGFAQYLDGKFDDAFSTWHDLLRDYPRTNIKLRTKFWMARAAQKAQHAPQAETLYREVIKELPFSYYALLSSWFGGIDLARNMDAELPSATDETPLLTPADVVHIKRAEMLIASAVPELALIELHDVHPTLNMPNEFLVYLVALNNLAGNHQAAFQMLGELSTRSFQGLFSSYGQKLYFPTARLPLIRSIAKELKVDPLLVISIVKQESAFNPEAVSGANAYGLMQIIPSTARDLEPGVEIMDLFNPLLNVRLGGKYMHQLLARYKGNVILALAAYNAGPGHADHWQRDARPGLPLEEFIEQIGFKESREYVQNILRNYYWYNRRINGDNIQSLTSLTQFISGGAPPKPVNVSSVHSSRRRVSFRKIARTVRR